MGVPTDPERLKLFKQRQSEAQKRRFSDPEQRKATGEAIKKVVSTPEVRKRNSEQAKRIHSQPESKRRQSEAMKRLYAETDLRERVSQATKEAMQREDVEERRRQGRMRSREIESEIQSSPEYKAKLSASIKASDAANGERKRKISEAVKKRTNDPMFKENARKRMQSVWDDPETRERQLALLREGQSKPGYRESIAATQAATRKFSGTSIEVIVEAVLKALEVEYDTQKAFGRWRVDFYVPDKNLVIECDGDYWHSTPKVKERDARKDAYLASLGLTVLRLPECRIRKGELDDLLNSLK